MPALTTGGSGVSVNHASAVLYLLPPGLMHPSSVGISMTRLRIRWIVGSVFATMDELILSLDLYVQRRMGRQIGRFLLV